MSINLSKGQKISLSKEHAGLDHIMVGLGWDPAKQGLFRPIAEIDCDASAIALDENGKLVRCVYYGDRSFDRNAIVHHGDNLTGAGSGDDEQISISLSSLPDKVRRIVFTVNIYRAYSRRQDFGMIKNAYIRLVDEVARTEICRFNLSDNYSKKTAMIFAEVYRKDGEWKFEVIGRGTTDDSIGSLLNLYR